MSAKNLVAIGALLAALVGAREATAQTPSERVTARQLMDDGDRYAEQKQFAEALRVYVAAHTIMHVPSTGIEVARTYAALGRLVEARETALKVTKMPVEGNEPKPFAAARREAAELAEQLDKRIPTLRLELSGGADPATVHATIDGTEIPGKSLALPQRVDPGFRAVRVRAAGFAPIVRQVAAMEGTTTVVRVDLDVSSTSDPAPRAASSSSSLFDLPPAALGGLAAAAAGVTIGTITGIISLDKASDARTLCGPDTKNCDPSAASTIDSSKTYGWIATASFAIAVAGGALATYTIFANKDSSRSARKVDVFVAGGGAGLRGTF
jgi:hypothetical protein